MNIRFFCLLLPLTLHNTTKVVWNVYNSHKKDTKYDTYCSRYYNFIQVKDWQIKVSL